MFLKPLILGILSCGKIIRLPPPPLIYFCNLCSRYFERKIPGCFFLFRLASAFHQRDKLLGFAPKAAPQRAVAQGCALSASQIRAEESKQRLDVSENLFLRVCVRGGDPKSPIPGAVVCRWRCRSGLYRRGRPESSDLSRSAGGEAVNAQVCKACIRGFNSCPALQT
jgi:hypothetical protein